MSISYSKEQISQLNEHISAHFPHLSQVTPSMKITYEGISRMVMLDRYSQKDFNLKTLAKGDLVIAKIKYDPKFPTLGLGLVEAVGQKDVVIKVFEEYLPQIDPSHNPTPEGLISLLKQDISKPLEIYYEQIADRVSRHLAEDEKEFDKWHNSFFEQISSGNIVPAGRILYGAGSGTKVTYFNCFVMPMVKDSREGISQHREKVMEIMSRGGGVGTNGSTLRPRDTIALTIGGKSSGAISWLNDLASLTDLVQQGGSRRGAQMIMLQDWHPDIIEFIVSKMQNPLILKWIYNNFEDETIKRVAHNKLKFIPLLDVEKRTYELVVHSADEEVASKAKKLLKDGGRYEVINPEFLSGANISVGITHDFMQAVKNDAEYELRFPDIQAMTTEQKQYYDEFWHEIGDVRIWKDKGYPVKTYKKIKARELWDLINFCATYSAEPGVFFIDTANDMTNAVSYGQKVVSTNPCGEQPLAPYSVCNLGAVNLSNFVNHKTGEILWKELEEAVRVAVRLHDNIIDKTPYFLDENEKQAKGERRVGLGVMGLHDLLIWSGLKYGSEEANKLVDKIFEVMATTAYMTSADLGKEKGSFGFLKDIDSILNTGYVKKLPEHVRNYIKEANGLRNSHLLTIAPTGTTGTMIGVSTGLEPYFAFKYYRSGRLGKFIEVDQAIVAEYRQIHNLSPEEKLPDIFISAMELSPEEHAQTQVVIQRWIDSSISKTVNAPKGYSVKQVEKIYTWLYDHGAKGGTVYVDGSRDSQVLSLTSEDNQSNTGLIILPNVEQKLEEIKESHADVPGNKQDKKIGIEIGDLCPICKEGTVEDMGGCNSCTNCGAQLKCGI